MSLNSSGITGSCKAGDDCGVNSGRSLWCRYSKIFLNKIQEFWVIQLAGWALFSLFKLTPTIAYLGSVSHGSWVCVHQGLVGFVFSFILRSVLRRRGAGELAFLGKFFLCSIAAGLVDTLLLMGFDEILMPDRQGPSLNLLLYSRPVVYLGWSAVYLVVSEVQKSRQRELDLHAARNSSLHAEIQMLRSQIDPHFLFNAFNTILASLGKNADSAELLVQSLSDYFRYSLDCRGEKMVPIEREFESLRSYLVVEKSRFRDDLLIETHLDAGAGGVMVPGIMLQPLVENALKHGFLTSSLPLQIRLLVELVDAGKMKVEVVNSGLWVCPSVDSEKMSGGNGLDLLRSRLKLIYGDNVRMEFPAAVERAEVVMRIFVPVEIDTKNES